MSESCLVLGMMSLSNTRYFVRFFEKAINTHIICERKITHSVIISPRMGAFI